MKNKTLLLIPRQPTQPQLRSLFQRLWFCCKPHQRSLFQRLWFRREPLCRWLFPSTRPALFRPALSPSAALSRPAALFLTALLLLHSPALRAGEPDAGEPAAGDAWQFAVSATGTAGTGDHAPFWFTSLRHGLATTAPSSAYLRTAATRSYVHARHGFDWECGADLAAQTGFVGYRPVILQQLYAGARLGCWELTVGAKEHASQSKNVRLTTGGMTWSGNARPVPQVRFGIDDYVTVPWLHDWLRVKGFISYGMMTDDHFQQTFVSTSRYAIYNSGALLHEKSAFLRFGNPERTPWSAEWGLEMDCMFGGKQWEHDARLSTTDTEHLIYDHPQAPADFLKAILPLNGGEASTISDQQNAAGNHFGSCHQSITYDNGRWAIRLFGEHYFESRCGMTSWNGTHDMEGVHHSWFPYPWFDGLRGIDLRLPANPYVSNVLIECNTTRDQCGSIHHGASANLPANIYGFACYYYNSSYPSWHHYGMTAGSPLLYSPLYNEGNGNTLIITNTRIRSFHLGLDGNPLPALSWRALATYVRSWGSYIDPLPEPANAFSALAEVTWTCNATPSSASSSSSSPRTPSSPSTTSPHQATSILDGVSATLGLGLDRSTLIGNNIGASLTLKKTF